MRRPRKIRGVRPPPKRPNHRTQLPQSPQQRALLLRGHLRRSLSHPYIHQTRHFAPTFLRIFLFSVTSVAPLCLCVNSFLSLSYLKSNNTSTVPFAGSVCKKCP